MAIGYYKSENPRSKHLRELAENICYQKDTWEIYNKCKKIKGTVHAKKGIFPNVDFYSALIMHALGIPRDFFTAFFAASRVTGWVANTLEQYTDAILISSTLEYVGAYGRKFIPIDERI